jgi:type VI secretion system protein ImpJ
MSWRNPVIWTQGMFLRPQHFQQQGRHFRGWIEDRCGGLHPYSWGITRLEIDTQKLSLGKFAIKSCSGIFPDGTPFNMPDNHPLPPPLEIQPQHKNETLELALLLETSNGIDVSNAESDQSLSRYIRQELSIRDQHTESNSAEAVIETGSLATRIRLGSQDKGAFATIPVARLIERRSDDMVLLDEQFIPTCLHCIGSQRLTDSIRDIQGLLHHRGEELASSLGSPGAGGVGEFVGFLLLQCINQYEPLFKHLVQTAALHPETLYSILVQMAGELATITSERRRPDDYPTYNHQDLSHSFGDLIRSIRTSLDWALDKPAVAIELVKHPRGVYTAIVFEKELIKSAQFVLAIKAQISVDKLQSQITRQTTIASKDQLSQLVKSHLPGIPIRALPVAPRQIPFHAEFTYFELDKHNEVWKGVEETGSFAMFFSGDYPAMELEFWAIKGMST